MKAVFRSLIVGGGFLFAGVAMAHHQSGHGEPAAHPVAAGRSMPTTLKGEIVDASCYLAERAMGKSHKSCASRCIGEGKPMALLTAEGKLYLVTASRKARGAYSACRELAPSAVEVTGFLRGRNGIRAIEVTAVKPATSR